MGELVDCVDDGRVSEFLRRHQEDFSAAVFLLRVGDGVRRAVQRIGGRHGQVEAARAHGVEGGLQIGGDVVARGLAQPGVEPEAAEDDAAEDEERGGQLHGLARHGAVGDVDAAVIQRGGQAQGGGAAHGVEGQGERRARGGANLLGGELVVVGQFDDVLAGVVCGVGGAAGEVDEAQATRGGEGGDAAAHGGVGRVLKHAAARGKRCALKQAQGGERVDEGLGGEGVGDVVGHGVERAGGMQGVFAPCAGGVWEDDAAAGQPSGRVRAKGHHAAKALVARGEGGSDFFAVAALDDVDVGRVDGGGEEAHQSLAGAGFGHGLADDAQGVGGARRDALDEGVHDGDFSGCRVVAIRLDESDRSGGSHGSRVIRRLFKKPGGY